MLTPDLPQTASPESSAICAAPSMPSPATPTRPTLTRTARAEVRACLARLQLAGVALGAALQGWPTAGARAAVELSPPSGVC